METTPKHKLEWFEIKVERCTEGTMLGSYAQRVRKAFKPKVVRQAGHPVCFRWDSPCLAGCAVPGVGATPPSTCPLWLHALHPGEPPRGPGRAFFTLKPLPDGCWGFSAKSNVWRKLQT